MDAATDDDLLVACLCAAWCGTCREYRPVFDAAAARHGAGRWHWVDIEDDDEVVGDIDVENFPTLLIARGGRVVFFGAVTPHGATLERLVGNAATRVDEGRTDASLLTLAGRIRAAAACR